MTRSIMNVSRSVTSRHNTQCILPVDLHTQPPQCALYKLYSHTQSMYLFCTGGGHFGYLTGLFSNTQPQYHTITLQAISFDTYSGM